MKWNRSRRSIRCSAPVKQKYVRLPIYPKTHYVMKPETRSKAVQSIREELAWWEAELEKQGRVVEAQRVHQRTMYRPGDD